MPSWKDAEGHVRRAAGSIWSTTFRSELVHGRQIDCYATLSNGNFVAIEVTEKKDINKIQEDINKLIYIRIANFNDGFKHTECLCVTAFDPTDAMKAVGRKLNIEVKSLGEFQRRFMNFDEYYAKRIEVPFGSAIDPKTGKKDNRKYTPVTFVGPQKSETSSDGLMQLILGGGPVVLLGEYGTGKSKFTEAIFDFFSKSAWERLAFPVAIDLRKCWGLKDKYEILKRHLTELNMAEDVNSFVKAYNSGYLILIVDGFDELGTQIWSDDSEKLKSLRANALEGVRDLFRNRSSRLIITGREHYFDSDEEMISSLGLSAHGVEIFRTKTEFSYNEITDFLRDENESAEVPIWLPRKPLTVEFFLTLMRDAGKSIDIDIDYAQFWDVFLRAVCEREARIHTSFDPETIKLLLEEVAASTRKKSHDVGPLSLGEIQSAYHKVVGHAPIDQASVLLQRFPGLGRVSADSEERQFVDTYLLSGLRAEHMLRMVELNDNNIWDEDWINPLDESGISICGRKIGMFNQMSNAISYARRNEKRKNKTLGADIIASLLRSGANILDMSNAFVEDASISILDFSSALVSNLHVHNSVIRDINITRCNVNNVIIKECTIDIVEGISSAEVLPSWFESCSVRKTTSLATTSRIRDANLAAPQKVLITVLRKTFFQKGAGRKEEALLRGLGGLVKSGTLDKIIGRLISEKMLTKERGDEGNLYIPVNSQRPRAGKMLAELSLSQDPIWKFVSDL